MRRKGWTQGRWWEKQQKELAVSLLAIFHSVKHWNCQGVNFEHLASNQWGRNFDCLVTFFLIGFSDFSPPPLPPIVYRLLGRNFSKEYMLDIWNVDHSMSELALPHWLGYSCLRYQVKERGRTHSPNITNDTVEGAGPFKGLSAFSGTKVNCLLCAPRAAEVTSGLRDGPGKKYNLRHQGERQS